MSPTIPTAVQYISSHILTQLSLHRSKFTSITPPLFIALQGPQGSGKSYLTNNLRTYLSSPPHSLHLAVLSLDDLYLPHAGLRALADAHPANNLWKGRGQPGTHDMQLGVELLDALKDINKDSRKEVEVPSFDKSLFDGEGDRVSLGGGVIVESPLDVVVMEGWCMGFYPISASEIDRRWEDVWKKERVRLGMVETLCRKEDIVMVNEKLKEYVRMWELFQAFVLLKPAVSSSETGAPDTSPSPYTIVYKWRLEQEHAMKALNGGRGMSDEGVKSFVDRYIPGYVFFGDGVMSGHVSPPIEPLATQTTNNMETRAGTGVIHSPPWIGNGLIVTIGEQRGVIDVGVF